MIILHLLILYLLTVVPLRGYFTYKKFKQDVRVQPGKRMAHYRKAVTEFWILAAVFTGVVLSKDIPLTQLGFTGVEWGPISVLLTAGLFSFIIAPLLLAVWVSGYRELMEKQLLSTGDFLLATAQEKSFWIWVSLTAGICEELLFRSCLFYYISLLIPGLPAVWIILISGLVFGVGHGYQGLKGVVTTTLLGAIFGSLYYFTGSILLCMLLHFLVDVRILALLPRK